jgi:hypothetical protein
MSGLVTLSCIIEGKGERAAVPALLRRLALERWQLSINVPPPVLRGRGELVRAGGLEKDVELAARRVTGTGGIFIILDADDDCPADLGPQLLERARRARKDMRIGLVLANREYESWFLAAAESLRSVRQLPADLEPPDVDVETIRGAKEWLKLRGGYNPVVDQAALTAKLDLDLAQQRSPSFDKCIREVHKLIAPLLSSPA